MQQPIGMMNTFRIARDLLADYAVGIGVTPRAAHTANGARVDDFDIKGAGAGAIVRADGRCDGKRGVHGYPARENLRKYISTK